MFWEYVITAKYLDEEEEEIESTRTQSAQQAVQWFAECNLLFDLDIYKITLKKRTTRPADFFIQFRLKFIRRNGNTLLDNANIHNHIAYHHLHYILISVSRYH